MEKFRKKQLWAYEWEGKWEWDDWKSVMAVKREHSHRLSLFYESLVFALEWLPLDSRLSAALLYGVNVKHPEAAAREWEWKNN